MKGVTPVISLIMMMLVTVGTVGVSYTWLSGIATVNTEKIITIPPGGAQCYNDKINVVARNSGTTSNITDDDIIVADIDGTNSRNTPFFGGFNTNGLVGYWRFEQSNGSAATNDSSGYGNMGTLTNINLTGNASSGLTQGRFGNALQFDGVNDYVDTGNSASLNLMSMTFTAWLKPTGASIQAYVLAKFAGGAEPTYYVYWNGVNDKVTLGTDGTGGGERFSDAVFTDNNEWVFVAVTDDASGNIRFYRNGVLAGTPATAAIGQNNQRLTIGARLPGVGIFNGVIDEVQIWNRALTPEEILQLNKTGSGNFTLGPNQGMRLINNYPVFSSGKYTVRIGTKNGITETTVNCL